MIVPTPLLTFLLTLPLLALSATIGESSVGPLPVYSSIKERFVLRGPDGFNVFGKYNEDLKQHVLVISRTKARLTEFELHHGNLTTVDEARPAHFGPVPLIYPPVLTPLNFGKSSPAVAAPFVVEHRRNEKGNRVPALFWLGQPLVVREISEGQRIYGKPKGNIERTVGIVLEVSIVRDHGFSSYEAQELL